MEQNARLYQSKYVMSCNLFGFELKSKEVLYETATIENDLGRIDFEFSFEQFFSPEVAIRDAIESGFLVEIQCEEPKMMIVKYSFICKADDGEKKPVLSGDELPEQ